MLNKVNGFFEAWCINQNQRRLLEKKQLRITKKKAFERIFASASLFDFLSAKI
jgi:hypothetical protein